MNKGLMIESGHTHMQNHPEPLMKRIVDDGIDPSFVITHKGGPDDAPVMSEKFEARENGCIKVVLKP